MIICPLDSNSALPPGLAANQPVGFDPSGLPLFAAKPGERTCGSCLHASVCAELLTSGCWRGASAETCRHKLFTRVFILPVVFK